MKKESKRRPWIRLYTDVATDPKVQKINAKLFRFWINCLCFAGKNDGILPNDDDIAWVLGTSSAKVALLRHELIDSNLLEQNEDGLFFPHGWGERQFETDVSTERVKRFRKRKMKPDETVSETALTEQNRTEQNRTEGGNGFLNPNAREIFACGKTLEEWIDLLLVRHPKKSSIGMVEDALSKASANWEARARRAGVKSRESLFELIDRRHLAASQSAAWNGPDRKYVQQLPVWLDSESYNASDEIEEEYISATEEMT